MKTLLRFAVLAFLLTSQNIFAQVQTNNQFIWATVDNTTGLVTVLLPPGRVEVDPQLSFYDKSYFTCKIGTTYYTNNDVIVPFPASARHLNGGTTVKVADTVRTTWNVTGFDIIQDVYPVAFTKSGQIVYKWKFVNHTNSATTVQCQYLQDIQITDPNSKQQPNSSDGPIILTQSTYKPQWETFPSASNPATWFYIGFLYGIPNSPSYNPGLSAMGYLDYGEPLNLIVPQTFTIGDWYTMANTIFGNNPSWPGNGTSYGTGQIDNAALTVFPPISVLAGKTVEAGRTSYGTGEYEQCVGTLFSVVFYPHHFVWSPSTKSYSPDSIHVEKYVVDGFNGPPPANTKITLKVADSLWITDSVGKTDIARSQTQPTSGPGTFIGAGNVGYFDWWIRAEPRLICDGVVTDTLKFTGTCNICPPAFLNSLGADECDLPIIVDCAKADVDPPLYEVRYDSSLWKYNKLHVDVHDDRGTDVGLKSIEYAPQSGTDTTKFIVSAITPAISPCSTDKAVHTITITQLDSLVGGCYNFKFTDCLGHISGKQVCLAAHVDSAPDTLVPITLITSTQNVSGSWVVNLRDDRSHDKGIDSVTIISKVNASAPIVAVGKCSPTFSFFVTVLDSTKDASVCFHVADCAHNMHDTCIYFKGIIPAGVPNELQYRLSLEANHPNPFSHMTTFNYSVAQNGLVKLYLYDELGRELARIVNDLQTPGSHTVDFDGSKLPSGSYTVRLENGGTVVSRNVVIER